MGAESAGGVKDDSHPTKKFAKVLNVTEPGSPSELCPELGGSVKDRTRVPRLIELLGVDGHELHEDIVFDLGLIGDPAAIPAITKAVTAHFPYMHEWGGVHAFQRKCAYALARIGTLESRKVLEELARHEDAYLREYGKEGLSHWPCPYIER